MTKSIKSYFFLITIFFFLSISISYSQTPPKQESSSRVQDTAIVPDLKTIIQVKEEVQKEEVEVKEEKAQLAKEKKSLEQDLDGGSGFLFLKPVKENPDVIREKLETIKKKEEVVLIKEDLLKAKKETYERVVVLIEQKLKILRNKDISLESLYQEVVSAEKDIQKLVAEKNEAGREILHMEQEVSLIKQDLEAKRILAELKEEENFIGAIQTQEQQLSLLKEQLEKLQKKQKILDTQNEIIRNYLNIIKNKYKERFQKELLTAKTYRPSPSEQKTIAQVLGLLAFLFGLNIYLHRRGTHKKTIGHIVYIFGKSTIAFGILILLAHLLVSGAGYHRLSLYYLLPIIKTAGLFVCFLLSTRLMKAFLTAIFYFVLHNDKEKIKTVNPLFVFINSILWCGLVVALLFSFSFIWGVEYGNFGLIKKWLKFSFFSVGNIELSLLVIFQVGIIIWTLNFLSHFLNKFLINSVYPRTQLDESAKYTVSTFIKYLLIIIGGMTGLKVIGFELGTLTVLAGTIGIGIGLGIQEIAKNFISGIILLIERPIKVGDLIEVDNLPGRVHAIKARGTVINTFDNIDVLVPNSDFVNKKVINWTHNDKIVRLCVPVGVAYGSDVDLVRTGLLEVAEKHSKVLHKPVPYVYFSEFGDNALNFKLYGWVEDAENRLIIASDLHFMIDKLFRKRNLVIAFPQRDIHLKNSSIVVEIKKPEES